MSKLLHGIGGDFMACFRASKSSPQAIYITCVMVPILRTTVRVFAHCSLPQVILRQMYSCIGIVSAFANWQSADSTEANQRSPVIAQTIPIARSREKASQLIAFARDLGHLRSTHRRNSFLKLVAIILNLRREVLSHPSYGITLIKSLVALRLTLRVTYVR